MENNLLFIYIVLKIRRRIGVANGNLHDGFYNGSSFSWGN